MSVGFVELMWSVALRVVVRVCERFGVVMPGTCM